MNKLNELIALELGWEFLRPAMANVGRGQSTGIPPGELRTYVPNWAGDLNLMQELIKDLDRWNGTKELASEGHGSDAESYQWALIEIVLGFKREDYQPSEGTRHLDIGMACDNFMTPERLQYLLEATAEQKAIAWLKVKGVGV